MALPGEVGHITLPVVTQDEFDWRARMSKPGVLFESEDAITGGGLLRMYHAATDRPVLETPEAVLQAAREKRRHERARFGHGEAVQINLALDFPVATPQFAQHIVRQVITQKLEFFASLKTGFPGVFVA